MRPQECQGCQKTRKDQRINILMCFCANIQPKLNKLWKTVTIRFSWFYKVFLVCWPVSGHAPYWLLVFPSQVRTWISWSTSRCKNFSCRLPALRETKKLLSPYLLQKKWKLPEQGIEPGTSQSKIERSTNWAIEAFDTRLRILVDYVLQCCSWIKMGRLQTKAYIFCEQFLGAILWAIFGAIFGSNFQE